MSRIKIHKDQNYTAMFNYHLQNKEMSLKAKGLLSLMYSLPDNWTYSIEGLASISKEGVDCISQTLREIEKFGFIKRTRIRDEKGRLRSADYDVYDRPIWAKPILENPGQVNPEQDNPEQEKPGLLNTNKQNTKEINTDYINNSSYLFLSAESEAQNVDNSDEMRKDEKDQSPYQSWKRQIQTNVDYESLIQCYPYDRRLIDEIIELMVETVMSNGEYVQIASGKYPHSLVKEKFLGIDYGHMQYIVGCFNEGARNTEIKNIKQYMKALIFNAPTTIDSYYTAMVRHDMPWLGQKHDER